MGAGKLSKISHLAQGKKPQLACRHDAVHASCTISKISVFFNSLIYKGLTRFSDLAHCLQYPC